MSWGIITLDRLTLSEQHEVSDQINANTGARSVRLSGREWYPRITLAAVRAKQEDISALMGRLIPITFSRKLDRNGYYTATDVGVSATHWEEEASFFDWNLSLEFIGPDNVLEMESWLSNIARANDFDIDEGIRWHAPPIGHLAYYTGTTPPSAVLVRASLDGPISVYMGITAEFDPRWSCPVGSYVNGGCRMILDGLDRISTLMVANGQPWEVSNGLVRARSVGESLTVGVWSDGAWHDKSWGVLATSAIEDWDQVIVRTNRPDLVSVRLVKSLSPSGLVSLDLNIRRGSRFVEAYLQRSTVADLTVRLTDAEAYTDNSADGYVVASANDADDNRFIFGSARGFVDHADGGGTKEDAIAFDFFVGAVVGGDSAVTGDQALNLLDQYIAASSETTVVNPR